VRKAALLGLLSITQRRRRGKLSDTNVIAILDPSWLAWLRLKSKGQFADLHGYKKDSSSLKQPLAGRSDGAGSGFVPERRSTA
jgi:hypothetical protein